MSQEENLLDVVAAVYKWKWPILGTSFVAAIITAVASLTLDNHYQASTLFYAASPDLALPKRVGHETEKQRIYGNDNDLDRLLSLSQSSKVNDYLIEKFNLYDHYEINRDNPKAKHKLLLKLNKYYETKKTKYDAINLTVEDKDPEMAANMANAARGRIDALAQVLVKESQKKLLEAAHNSISTKEKEFVSYTDSLQRLGQRYGIFSSDAQGEAFGSKLVETEGNYLKYSAESDYLKSAGAPQDSIAKAKAKAAGYAKQLDALKKDVSKFSAGYPAFKSLERRIRDFGNNMSLEKDKMAQLQATYDSPITTIHVVEPATRPVVKSRPKRSLLVIGVAFFTFVMMTLWTLIKHQLDKNNWKEHFRNA